jgi:8-demethyl-8-alpha-L-rhamnosyltetracenomycin-C 2'-O-methyltransferase
MTLEEIAVRHPTDKLGTHSYLPIYERLFAQAKERDGAVIEIGVDGGGSLSIWQEWFARAAVLGMDINVRPPYIESRERITHWQGDAYTEDGLNRVKEFAGGKPILAIIDDGPHSIESQRWFCAHYPALLTPGGIALVEDIQRIEDAASLHFCLPDGMHSAVIDLRHIKNRYDDILFAAWK